MSCGIAELGADCLSDWTRELTCETVEPVGLLAVFRRPNREVDPRDVKADGLNVLFLRHCRIGDNASWRSGCGLIFIHSHNMPYRSISRPDKNRLNSLESAPCHDKITAPNQETVGSLLLSDLGVKQGFLRSGELHVISRY
mgnify:CR=1 FL=1